MNDKSLLVSMNKMAFQKEESHLQDFYFITENLTILLVDLQMRQIIINKKIYHLNHLSSFVKNIMIEQIIFLAIKKDNYKNNAPVAPKNIQKYFSKEPEKWKDYLDTYNQYLKEDHSYKSISLMKLNMYELYIKIKPSKNKNLPLIPVHSWYFDANENKIINLNLDLSV